MLEISVIVSKITGGLAKSQYSNPIKRTSGGIENRIINNTTIPIKACRMWFTADFTLSSDQAERMMRNHHQITYPIASKIEQTTITAIA